MPQPPSFHVRLPARLQKRLKHAAIEHERSLNAEIVARLEGSFELDEGERALTIERLRETLRMLERGG